MAATEWEYERLRAWRNLSTEAVVKDRWDRQTWERVRKAVTSLRAATNTLSGIIDTGPALMGDVVSLLHKASPNLQDRDKMRPESLLNHTIAGETIQLTDYTSVRRYTRGDEVGAALAAATMEPELETLIDRHRMRQQQAKDLQAKLDQLAEKMSEKIDLDEMIERWTADHPDEEVPDDMAGAAERLQGEADALQGEAGEMAADVEGAAGEDATMVRGAMAVGLRRAADQSKNEATMATMLYGKNPGTLKRLPVEERLKLARKLDHERLRDIIAKFGAIHNMSMSVRLRYNPTMQDEIVGVTIGRDLTRVLPSEFAKLRDPNRKHEFFRDYAEGRLMEFEFSGQERSNRGAIINCEDGSGSMFGERERWAKAFLINMLDIAREEGRSFHLIHFGSESELQPIDFSTPDTFTTERIFEAIEVFFNGGTDFMAPLTMAVQRLRDEFTSTGRVEGDIVFTTDGYCSVTPAWLQWFKQQQAELGFTVWGLVMGVDRESEPLWTICDGNVATVKDLAGGSDVGHIFQGI